MSATNTIFVIQYEDYDGAWIDWVRRHTIAEARMALEACDKAYRGEKHRIVKRTDEVVE